MIASAMEDLADALLQDGKSLPVPNLAADAPECRTDRTDSTLR